MNSALQILSKAGSKTGLPFLSLMLFLLQSSLSSLGREEPVLRFQVIESTCINLAHYDSKAMQLTVRFVGQDTDQFYRYSKVPPEIWRRIRLLNESADSVGNYFTATVVHHPEKFPFEKTLIRSFKIVPKKKKAGDSR